MKKNIYFCNVNLDVSHFNQNKEMIKKLLVVIMFAATVVACSDKKKEKAEEPNFIGVEALIERADELLALEEVTLVGKLDACPVSQEAVVLIGKGAFVQVVLAEGVSCDEFLGKAAQVTGKLSFVELTEECIAAMEEKFEEAKAACAEKCAKKAEEEKTCADSEEAKKCCKEKEKSCTELKVGDKFYTLTATKIEKFECPKAGKCCGDEKACEKKEGEKCCKEKTETEKTCAENETAEATEEKIEE